jgi:hypothetical protein
MSNEQAPPADARPLLRTLSPALRGLEKSLRAWLEGTHRYPLGAITRASLEGVTNDLRRSADALDVERPLLVVMLMGGTGVGKSTLLNALAGGNIAAASFARPTTRDPVVYYHESLRTDKLDPALRHCRLIPHDRPALEQKVIVDTPDVDSNDLTNREKLLRLLPVADVVLYVGSQEKYHDRLVWDLFKQQRKRRAFAFVLNKWDRCLYAGGTGLRPDEDLLRDLEAEGFEKPLLFRTCAQSWVDRFTQSEAPAPAPVALPVMPEGKAEAVAVPAGPDANGAVPAGALPEGEQFNDLVHWLEMGLTRLEIEAIKARGVSQLLKQAQESLEEACPPDLTEVAARAREVWKKPLNEEAAATADVLLNTLEPYAKEIEHHFALEGQRRFRGLMGAYLHAVTRIRYAGSTLTSRLPLVSRSREDDQPAAWDLTMFTRACTEVAANRELDSRTKALVNRLLIDADTQGFPLRLLSDPLEAIGKMDWRQRYSQALSEVLMEVEKNWSRPKGLRRVAKGAILILADWVPPLALLAALARLLWMFFDPYETGRYQVKLIDALLPLAILLVVLVILHLLITLLLPLRWSAIRNEFHTQLGARLKKELAAVYSAVPTDLAEELKAERERVEKLMADVREVANWLEKREQSASITSLYGH